MRTYQATLQCCCEVLYELDELSANKSESFGEFLLAIHVCQMPLKVSQNGRFTHVTSLFAEHDLRAVEESRNALVLVRFERLAYLTSRLSGWKWATDMLSTGAWRITARSAKWFSSSVENTET